MTPYDLQTIRMIGDVARFARIGRYASAYDDPGFWRLKVTTFERIAESHRGIDDKRAAECDDAALAARRSLARCLERLR